MLCLIKSKPPSLNLFVLVTTLPPSKTSNKASSVISNDQKGNFTIECIKERTAQIEITDNRAGVREEHLREGARSRTTNED
jgi:hypothetical protein